MNIDRSNLVNKFEYLTKQEIINHQRQIEATNLSIKEIQESQKLYQKVSSNAVNEVRLEMIGVKQRLEEFLQGVKSSLHVHEGKVGDGVGEVRLVAEEVDVCMRELQDHSFCLQAIEEDLSDFKKAFVDMEAKFKGLKKVCEEEAQRLHSQLNGSLQEEIKSHDLKIAQLVGSLEKMMDAVQESSKTLQYFSNSLDDIRKRTVYSEKKIENLYSLLGREKKK